MRKLYLKIVVAIWAVMLATTVGVALVVNLALPEDRQKLRQFSTGGHVAEIAGRATEAAPGSGEEGLIRWFEEHVERRIGPPLTLLDDAGNVLAGDALPDARPIGGESVPTAGMYREFTHDGKRYAIVSRAPPGRMVSRSWRAPRLATGNMLIALRPPSFWLLLLVAVPLSVLLSFGIARYLVRPLRAIEQAGRRLSEGDLSARVGPALGNRGDEIADFATAFDRMATRIETLVCAHKDLLRDVSHELRSPLARAHAALSLARQRTSGAVDNELDRLELEIERLDSMIGKLLTFSRLDSGEGRITREPVELAGLLGEVVADCQFEATSNDKAVRLQPSEPLTVVGDPALLASCFENVIRNAVRHTAAATAVEIRLSREPAPRSQFCHVDIRDHGTGVPEAELQHIFEPFYRVGTGAASGNAHSGIGLAIARRAVTLHGGTIDAANAPDGGLIVAISLPVHDGD